MRCISEAAVRHGQTASKLCSGFAKQEEQLSSMATRQAVHQAMYNYKTSCPPGMEQLQGAMLQDTPDTNSLVAFASAVANKMLVTICLVSLACVGHLKLVKPKGPYLVSLRVVFSGWNDSLLLLRGASWQAKEVLHQARPPVQGPLGQLPTHGLLHCVLDDLVYVIMHHSAGRDTVWQRHCLAETLSETLSGILNLQGSNATEEGQRSQPCRESSYLVPVLFMQHSATYRTTQ